VLQNDANKSQLRGAEKAPKQTVLYDQNVGLTDKSHIVSFAGYLMPLWYSSISGEHTAAREAAGIFDCTHMGVLEISGVDAAEFIDQLTTNSITNLKVKNAQYSFILDASGGVLDDVIVYRKDRDKFFVVVNAANNAKIKNWINTLLETEVCIDPENADRKVSTISEVRDLSDGDCKDDCRVDIALQGPKSLDVFSVLTQDKEAQSQIADLRPFQFMETDIKGIGCLVSRTGYTGAKSGFELFVHPERASQLWETILQAGKPLGLLPCGRGSRDSLRIEAGRSIGWVLSCARIGEKQIALVYVDRESLEENDAVGLYYSARSRSQIQQGRIQSIDKGELLEPDLTGKVVDRFVKF